MFALMLALSLVVPGGIATALILRDTRRRASRRKALGDAARGIVDHDIVTVVGTVRALAELTAPLHGTACVAYETRLQVGDQIFVEPKLVPFELVASNQRVGNDRVVRVEGPAFAFSTFDASPIIPRSVTRERAFLLRHGFDPELTGRTFLELAVAPGERIAVTGMALVGRDAGGHERGYRDEANVVRIVASADRPLSIERI